MATVQQFPEIQRWNGIPVREVTVDVIHGDDRTRLEMLGCIIEDADGCSNGSDSWYRQRVTFPQGTQFISYTNKVDVNKWHVYRIGEFLYSFKRRRFDGALMNVFSYATPDEVEALLKHLKRTERASYPMDEPFRQFHA